MKRASSSTNGENDYDDADSNPSSTLSSDLTLSNDEQLQKNFIHKEIERKRRDFEKRLLDELSTLLPHWYDSTRSKLTRVDKLELAADLLTQMNANQSNPLLPSYLTQDEKNFIDIQASHSFIFVLTLDEAPLFRIIHVSDSISRILHVMPEDWLDKDFLLLMHFDDRTFVENQLSNLMKTIGRQTSFQCRLDQGDSSYLTVHIDGLIKKLDQSILTTPTDQLEYYAFVGICHLPLVNLYSQTNRDLHQNAFICRCTAENWQIFSVHGLQSSEVLRTRSILDFICPDYRALVHQALYDATVSLQEQSTFCNFIHPSGEISTMLLKIKPMVNPSIQKLDFLELVFEDYTDSRDRQ